MPSCPNCFYSLVLLEHRRRYKCARCGGLFPQRLIEDADFVAWNKRRRKEEEERVEKELQEITEQNNKKLTKEEIYEKKLILQRKWNKKNREYINAYKREYWAKHHDGLLAKRKENYKKRKAEILEQQKAYRQNNKELSRLKHLRDIQKDLAVEKFESATNEAYKDKILSFLLTF